MKKIDIYDPAMCCATGVCGPGVDPELMQVATLVNYLAKNGIDIKRHNLSSEPQDFVTNKTVSDLLTKDGADVLPITLADGEVVKTKAYPTKEEFSKWLGISIVAGAPRKSKKGCGCSNNSCC
jgi:hypothetical protein